jgi:hypothetical protein
VPTADVIAAAREYIAARDHEREMYIQTARNAPKEHVVKAQKAARVRKAEENLRAALEAHDG